MRLNHKLLDKLVRKRGAWRAQITMERRKRDPSERRIANAEERIRELEEKMARARR